MESVIKGEGFKNGLAQKQCYQGGGSCKWTGPLKSNEERSNDVCVIHYIYSEHLWKIMEDINYIHFCGMLCGFKSRHKIGSSTPAVGKFVKPSG